MTKDVSSPIPTRLEGKIKANVVCWILGLGSLVAWNSMLTITDYYYDLFPKYHPSRVLTLVYQPFANISVALLTYYEARLNTRNRNISGYVLYTLCTFGLIVVDLVSSGTGGPANYIWICVLVGGFGIADGLVQGGMVGDLYLMCPDFVQSFFAGLAASGALTSGLRLMTKAIFDKTDHGLRKGVIMFLAMSTFIEFVCIFLYAYVFGKLPIVKYFRKKASTEGSLTVQADLKSVGILNSNSSEEKENDRLTNKQLLLQNLDYGIALFLVYVITLSIFPGFLSENTGVHDLGDWYSVVLIAMYNVFDLVGRYVPWIEFIKMESRKGMVISSVLRCLFIPAFYFTAKYADQGYMMLLISLLGLTNGYLTVCILTAAPKGYKAPEQNALGNLLVMFLLGGIFTGCCLDWLWIIGNGKF